MEKNKKSKLRLSIAIEVILLTVIILIFSMGSVYSLTRRITAGDPAEDDVETFIRNSNGKIWSATGNNIQNAIDDIGINVDYQGYGNPHAYVWLPGNTTFTTTGTIEIKDHITLDMQGSSIVPNGDFHVVNLTIGSSIQNGVINASGVGSFDSACITFECDGSAKSLGMRTHFPYIHKMAFVSDGMRGIGINISIPSGYGSTAYASNIVFDDIQLTGFEYAIWLNYDNVGDASYINSNRFTNIEISNTTYPITCFNSDEECAGNIFSNVRIYCNASTEYIIWNNGANQFDMIWAYDWDNSSGTRTSYNLSEKGASCSHQAGNNVWLAFYGGGNDISILAYNAWTPSNCYALLNLDNSSLMIGRIVDL